MCRLCTGNPPTANDHAAFVGRVRAMRLAWENATGARAATNPQFIKDVVELDRSRLTRGPGWGNPDYGGQPINLIFQNPNVHDGLLLYVLANWLDAQAQFHVVWSTYLNQAHAWIGGRANHPPRNGFAIIGPHLIETRNQAVQSGNISSWFAKEIIDIAQTRGPQRGNLTHLAHAIARDLLDVPAHKITRQQQALRNGEDIMLGDWKRLWVLLRGLRRDQSLTRCLFTRALRQLPNGQRALDYWYDDKFFDPIECQLPVDRKVKEHWIAIMSLVILTPAQLQARIDGTRSRQVASEARNLATLHGISPSCFDVLFYG